MNNIVAGVDIGGTNTVIGLVTQQGDCIKEVSFPTQQDSNFLDYVARIASEISKLLAGINHDFTLAGVGVGAPNGSYYTGEIVDAANLRWKGSLPLTSELNRLLNVPVALTNDANAAAIGEMQFGDPIGLGPEVSLVLTVFAEVVCSILIVLGLGTRLAAIPSIVTMAVAAFIVHGADPFGRKEMALLYLVGYVVLLLSGSGKFSVDRIISKK